MATQSSSATLENCLPAMDYLLGLFEEAKVRYRDDPFMASRVNSAWSKLDKYYTKTNDSTAYIAALVLDPCMKWEYITSTWQPEWIPDAKALVVKLQKKYRPSNPTLTQIEEVIQEPTKQPLNAFTTWKQQKSARRADHIDEYARNTREPPVSQDHIKQGASIDCSKGMMTYQRRPLVSGGIPFAEQ